MKSPAIRFIVAVLSLTTLCVIAELLGNASLPEKWRLTNGFLMPLIIAIVVSLIHLFLLNSAKGSAQAFIRGFMASTVIKFFIYLLVLIVYLLFTDESKNAVVLHFLVYYLLFTVLEVTMLYQQLNQAKGNTPQRG